jgi:hypothetical protein
MNSDIVNQFFPSLSLNKFEDIHKEKTNDMAYIFFKAIDNRGTQEKCLVSISKRSTKNQGKCIGPYVYGTRADITPVGKTGVN